MFVHIIGHNGSGKTTLAKQLASEFPFSRVSGDDFRHFMIDNVSYFHGLDLAHEHEGHDVLSPLVGIYRLEASMALLHAGQNIILEGSGFKKVFRDKYLHRIKAELPVVKTAAIIAGASEEELLKRLRLRDTEHGDTAWQDQYFKKRDTLEQPEPGEFDLVLHFNQLNYDEIRTQLVAFML